MDDAPLLVPAGHYPLVSGDRELEAFTLDRDLVTVARYRAFIDDGGYDTEEHWDPEGWSWRNEEGIETPRFWDDPEWTHVLDGAQPVVGVSWWEARAFCRSIGRRLPAEFEWEAAVQSDDARTYPWGDTWQDGLLGIRGIGERRTWPVGSWPGANGPFGHRDLIGNVWQWTTDVWSEQEPDTMAVKGGSWASRPDQMRVGVRNGYAREGRWSHVGFRTAADG